MNDNRPLRQQLVDSLDLRDSRTAASLGITVAEFREALAQATPEGRLALLNPIPAFAVAVTREESLADYESTTLATRRDASIER